MDRVGEIVERLDRTPLSLDISWEEIEETLQCSLPADFKALCETFGRGTFSGALEIASSSGGSDLGVLSEWRSLQRIVEVNRLAAEDLRRFGVYRAGSGGLLPWADTGAPCQIYWPASDEPPEEWPIVVQDSEGEWSTHPMSSSEFLLRFLMDHQFWFGVAEYGPPYYDPAP